MTTQAQDREEPKREAGVGEFYVVAAAAGTWHVSSDAAARIGSQLDRRLRSAWVKFVDVYGARVWLRTATIEAVFESTERIRSRNREFQYHWRKEEQLDRRWDEEHG